MPPVGLTREQLRAYYREQYHKNKHRPEVKARIKKYVSRPDIKKRLAQYKQNERNRIKSDPERYARYLEHHRKRTVKKALTPEQYQRKLERGREFRKSPEGRAWYREWCRLRRLREKIYKSLSAISDSSAVFSVLAAHSIYVLDRQLWIDKQEQEQEQEQKVALKGIHDEFTALYSPIYKKMYSYAFKFTQDNDKAADLLQNSVMTAYRFFDKFEPGTNFAAWLTTIIKNQFINSTRSAKIEKKTSSYSQDGNEYLIEKKEFSTSSHEYEEDFNDEIRMALKRLSKEFREVIMLCDIENYADYEVAEMLGIPNGTVKSRLFKARNKLKDLLKDWRESEGYVVSEKVKRGGRIRVAENRKLDAD
jgi:RNA polymerase sigma-70 factor, ECF subfamily